MVRTTEARTGTARAEKASRLQLGGDQAPFGFVAGDVNLYRYVGNDPVNAVDPSGLAPSVEATIVIKGDAKSSVVKGKYTPPGGKEVESSDAQLSYRKGYDKRYDGPTEFKATYKIVFKANGTLDTTKSTIELTTVNYTERIYFRQFKDAEFTKEDEEKVVKDGGSVFRDGVYAYEYGKAKLKKDAWSSLPIPITDVTLKGCDVASFKFKSDKWYPPGEAKNSGLIDKGVEGEIDLAGGKGAFTGKYQTTPDAVITSYTLSGKIEK